MRRKLTDFVGLLVLIVIVVCSVGAVSDLLENKESDRRYASFFTEEQAVDVLRSEQAEYEKKGIQIGEDGVKFEKLTKEMVDAFVKEVRVYAKDQIEIVWNFSKPAE